MNLNDPDSGLYALARLAIIAGAALGALWITSTQFDSTEWKAMAPIVVAVLGSEVWRRMQITEAKSRASRNQDGSRFDIER